MSSWQRALAENPSTSGPHVNLETTAEQDRLDPWRTATVPNGATDISWPEPVTADSEEDRVSSEPRSKPDDEAERSERVPWRAATELAWMRRRRGAEDESTSGHQDSLP